jgi:hypothetical protein
MRCLDLLLDHDETSNIPVIIYSVVNEHNINDKVVYQKPTVLFLKKSGERVSLIWHIRSLLQGSPKASKAETSFWQRIWNAAEIKPGLGGLSFEIKRAFGSDEDS